MQSRKVNGLMAEWLGSGLQNLLQRFESASDLQKKIAINLVNCDFSFYLYRLFEAETVFAILQNYTVIIASAIQDYFLVFRRNVDAGCCAFRNEKGNI